MNGMDEQQKAINERMSGPLDPDSPAALRNEIERLRKALEEINSQAVCFCIAREEECFQMLENCAKISDAALSFSSGIRTLETREGK